MYKRQRPAETIQRADDHPSKLERGLHRTAEELAVKRCHPRTNPHNNGGLPSKLERGLHRTPEELAAKRHSHPTTPITNTEPSSTAATTPAIYDESVPLDDSQEVHEEDAAPTALEDDEEAQIIEEREEAAVTAIFPNNPLLPAQNHQTISIANLAVAREVQEESQDNLVRAEEVDPAVLERKSLEERKNKQCLRFGLCLMVISLGVMCAALLGVSDNGDDNSGHKDSGSLVPAQTPSMPPSEAPSLAVTDALDLLRGNLPDDTLLSLQNTSTPQWKALDWLSRHPERHEMPEWRKRQLFALAAFFFAMEGPNWPEAIQNDWVLYEKSECLWFSSEFGSFFENGTYKEGSAYNFTPCNNVGEFQSLVLANLGLSNYTPTIPPEIGLLSALSILGLPLPLSWE